MAVSSEKFSANNDLQVYKFDPNGTAETEIAWVDMRDYGCFHATFARTVGTSNVTFKIMANDQSDGSGADVDVKTHAVGSQPDAIDEQLSLEVTAAELADLGTDLRYVTAVVSVATGTDEGSIVYVRSQPRFARQNLTTDIVA